MNNPNIAPNPPPITPAITVFPTQLSIAPCIYTCVSTGLHPSTFHPSLSILSHPAHTVFTIAASCSDIPALGFIPGGVNDISYINEWMYWGG